MCHSELEHIAGKIFARFKVQSPADVKLPRALQALKQLHADFEANGTGIVPLMYEEGRIYDCS